MHCVQINAKPGYLEWREKARECLLADLKPEQTVWHAEHQQVLLQLDCSALAHVIKKPETFKIPKLFLELAQAAACHQDPDRFNLLYRILWRLLHENKQLLHYQTDSDILKLTALVKAVRRDAYKIKAFLRFREVEQNEQINYVAWYEPEHYTLELSLPFFTTRFKNMSWCILTPYRAAHWNGELLTLTDNPDPSLKPESDTVEAYWLKYYASTFNPARVKVKAMLAQMPKKYWKNMPETILIQELIQNAPQQVQTMLAHYPTQT